jgi:DNA-binding MarR family transcriptional regulator
MKTFHPGEYGEADSEIKSGRIAAPFDRALQTDLTHSRQNRSPSLEALLALSDRICAARNRRPEFLAPELFSEPGWEMMIALFRADAAGHRMTVSSLCRASNGPDTTALRWLEKLTELGLVFRRKNPLDGRIVFIELEAAARNAIQSYLSEVWASMYGDI